MMPERVCVPEPDLTRFMPLWPSAMTPEYESETPLCGFKVRLVTGLYPVVMVDAKFTLPVSPPMVGVVTPDPKLITAPTLEPVLKLLS